MDNSPVPIEKGEGTAECWSGDTQHDGSSHHLPPGVLYSEEHKIILAFPLVLECDILELECDLLFTSYHSVTGLLNEVGICS